MTKKNLSGVGDKKPFQHSDPVLTKFIHSFFPNAVFIHLVRHPFAVALSAKQFNRAQSGDFWKDLTLEELVERWPQHENGVLQLKQSTWTKVLDVRYEDLCRDPENELVHIFSFLDLEFDKNILKKASRNTFYRIREMPKITCSKEASSIMKLYGYNPEEAVKINLETFFTNIYRNLRKKFE